MAARTTARNEGSLLWNEYVRQVRDWATWLFLAVLFFGAVNSSARQLIDGFEFLVKAVDAYRAAVYPVKDAFFSVWPQWARPTNEQFDYFTIAFTMAARGFDWGTTWEIVSSRIKRRIWPPYPRSFMRRPEVRKGGVLLDLAALALALFPLAQALWIASLLQYWRTLLWQICAVLFMIAGPWWLSRSEAEPRRSESRRTFLASGLVGLSLILLRALNANADTALPIFERVWDATQKTFDDLAGAGKELRPNVE